MRIFEEDDKPVFPGQGGGLEGWSRDARTFMRPFEVQSEAGSPSKHLVCSKGILVLFSQHVQVRFARLKPSAHTIL